MCRMVGPISVGILYTLAYDSDPLGYCLTLGSHFQSLELFSVQIWQSRIVTLPKLIENVETLMCHSRSLPQANVYKSVSPS